MSSRSTMFSRCLLAVTLSFTVVALTACSRAANDSPANNFGNATPEVSQPATNPDGTIIALPSGQDQVTDMEVATGNILGVRTPETLAVGTVEDFTSGRQRVLDVDKQCGDLTATDKTFVLPCPTGVYLIDATSPSLDKQQETDAPATAAALTSTGELLVGNNSEKTITIYRQDGSKDSFPTQDPSDQLIAVPVIDRHDAVVRTFAANTTIQDMDWPNNKMGATLRVGLGVAQIAGGEDGLIVASDANANQLAIYNADDVIRLQMTAPVDESPWAVAWDKTHALAWVTTTAKNQAVGYAIDSGVPVEKLRYNSVANALNMVVLSDGSLVIASASGDGIQHVK